MSHDDAQTADAHPHDADPDRASAASDPLGPFDHAVFEAECRERWDAAGIYRYRPPTDGRAAFSVDTPPPYVSAAHLHVGHAMSYTQAEIVVRYRRMRGDAVYYPMGFDDNGLPTERYVEKAHQLDQPGAPPLSRSAFRALCLDETRRGAEAYERLWRALGLSVDWSLRYSTIDAHCRRTAQWSFIDLYRQGRIARTDAPVAWDPTLQTALAQADLELIARRTKLHTLVFTGTDGAALPIATTRPELLPACVALYRHPDDPRYAGLSSAREPLDGREVPVLADADVDPAYGSGLMMVCTFGDADDVRRWRRDGLPLRVVIGPDGRLTEAAGRFAGATTGSAREAIVAELSSRGSYAGFAMVEQRVPVSERSQAPIEWRAVPSWCIRIVDLAPRLRARAAELRWHPAFMKERLDAWIDGLAYDWNISRQRKHGVPFPVWTCGACGEVVLAELGSLPVDPLEDPPPIDACPRCSGALTGDPDVMDTWMTSSLTPLIAANVVETPGRTAGPFPATVRVQAFEIVRTWLFYTLVKAELHRGALPFRDVMISGWGLDEQGHKISKRNLAPDPSGFSRFDPAQLIDRYGADAVRHWASRATLGRDLKFSLKDVKAGRRVGIKLWNAARLVVDLAPAGPAASAATARPLADRAPEDRGLAWGFDQALDALVRGLDAYDYATGLHALDRWFFDTLCDDWLESAKERIRRPELFAPGDADDARATAWQALRAALGAYAPYLPFVTDAVWLRLFAAHEAHPDGTPATSVHATAFPTPFGAEPVPGLDAVAEATALVRRWRTAEGIPQARGLAEAVFEAPPEEAAALNALLPTLRAACRCERIEVCAGSATVLTLRAARAP